MNVLYRWEAGDSNRHPRSRSGECDARRGRFADCTAIDNVPVATPSPGVTAAPILGSPTSPWFVLATLALLLTGAALLFRSARRES